MLYALDKCLSTYATTNVRARHDYDCPEHDLADMLNDLYWGSLIGSAQHDFRIADGDIIDIQKTRDGKLARIRINWVDQKSRLAGIEVLSDVTVTPVVDKANGLAVRKRGARWVVVDAKNKAVSEAHATREEAEFAKTELARGKAA